jgi:hypothetical protein
MSGGLVFLAPWVLGFFVALPVIWWLLRLLPPSPRRIAFPALMLLRGLATEEKTPARMPWWLLLLRLLLASLVILAFARPVVDPQPVLKSGGAALIAIDNNWAAARAWDARKEALHDLIAAAEHEERQVILLPTTPDASGAPLQAFGPMAAKAAYATADRIAPEPWPADWGKAQTLLEKISPDDVAYSVWLNSGIGGGDAKVFYDALKARGGLMDTRVLSDAGETPIYLLAPPAGDSEDDSFAVLRAATDKEAATTVLARAADGHELARASVSFTPGAARAMAKFDLPVEARNRMARLEIEGQRSAGATALLDADWQHRPVGIVGEKAEATEHSLLSGAFYIARALKPFADIHIDALDKLLAQNMAVIIVTDATPLDNRDLPALSGWIRKGGVFLRFAGPNLATAINPAEADLMPVPLRTGDRAMGGSMSWGAPQKLGDFPAASPFKGLAIAPDVSVNRQILAEPSADLAANTWAALADGTPLVTAKNMGHGLSVFFHVPARSEWSNLPLSGLFVAMLRRIVNLSAGVPSATNFASLAPASVLDAFGDEQPPGANVEPIAGSDFLTLKPGPAHPPGLYGAAGLRRAFNLGAALGPPEALTDILAESYHSQKSGVEWQPILLAAAFILLLIDFLVSLYLRGFVKLTGARVGAAAFLLAALFTLPAHADDKQAIELTSKTYLAYIETGDHEVDQLSQAGLVGLARVLERRTSLNDVGVAAVNPESDELAFFPLLYWPLTASERPLSPEAAHRVNDYLQHGGMILFDSGGEDVSDAAMQSRLAGIAIPPLVRIPQNHVLRRSFYLLDEFAGRFAGGDLWLEPEESSSYDGVATVIAGSGGWAGAWAVDDGGRPLYPCTPGGEIQREQAYRFGVNVVMYALTGNYKSDQMHIEALLERQRK